MAARRCYGCWFAGIVALAWSAPAAALLPIGCTEADNTRVAQYVDRQTQALVNGDTARFIALTNQMEDGFSKSCRTALNREQPVRTRCSANERGLAVVQIQTIFLSVLAGDLETAFLAFAQLEKAVSWDCWLALNQSDKPQVRASCSASELDYMAAQAGPMVSAVRSKLETDDDDPMEQVLQNIAGSVSPRCWSALEAVAAQLQEELERELLLQQQMERQQQMKKYSTPMPLPRVFDHGGGTFSAPGLGACGPSGCVIF